MKRAGVLCLVLAAGLMAACGEATQNSAPTGGGSVADDRPERTGQPSTKRSLPFESAKELCEVSIQPWARRDAIDGCMAGFDK
jgi:hypothetical protein